MTTWLEQRAWELARAELDRRSRRWYDQILRVTESTKTAGINMVNSGPGIGAARGKERRGKRLASLQFAVCDAVQAMAVEQQQRLRDDGQLPDGFIDDVVKRAKLIERQTSW
jgi:hypothetical protein